ncbi:unnamed protein product, partial [Polarella glacialis]
MAKGSPPGIGEVLASGPPGWSVPPGAHGSSSVQPVVSMPPVAQVQVPRNFPGHFKPHRLCNHWNAHGWCRKAETCTFAHGLEELHGDVHMQLSQQSALDPPTVAKDGRIVVPGVAKGAGRGRAAAPVEAMSQPAPIFSFPPPPSSAMPYSSSSAMPYGSTLSTNPTYQIPAGAAFRQPPGFSNYDLNNFEFNVGAQPFVPTVSKTPPAVLMQARQAELSPTPEGGEEE